MKWLGVRLLTAAASLLAIPATVHAQEDGRMSHRFAVSIGIGADAHAAPSFVDQLNAQTNPSETQRLGKVSTAIDLSIVPEYRFAPEWSAALEYGLLLNSHEASGANGRLDYRYTVHVPTALVHYGLRGDGFWWKAGGGLGYYFAALRQQFRGIEPAYEGHASGPALKLDASVGTAVARSVYGTAAVEFRAAFLGALRNANDTPLQVNGKDVNLQFFSFGLKLGLMVEL